VQINAELKNKPISRSLFKENNRRQRLSVVTRTDRPITRRQKDTQRVQTKSPPRLTIRKTSSGSSEHVWCWEWFAHAWSNQAFWEINTKWKSNRVYDAIPRQDLVMSSLRRLRPYEKLACRHISRQIIASS